MKLKLKRLMCLFRKHSWFVQRIPEHPNQYIRFMFICMECDLSVEKGIYFSPSNQKNNVVSFKNPQR